jgi:hypothetical protein
VGGLDFSLEIADGVCGLYIYLEGDLLAVRGDERGKYLEDFLLGGFDGDLHDGLQPRRTRHVI